jgi:hypothetical protein
MRTFGEEAEDLVKEHWQAHLRKQLWN